MFFDENGFSTEPNTLREFSAVVLAGYGGDLYPLVDPESDESSVPKALLPLANRPLVDGVLAWLATCAELQDVLVLAPTEHEKDISSHLRTKRNSQPNRINLECFEPAVGRKGTAGVLRWAHSKGYIRKSCILLPCDLCLVPTASAPTLQILLDHHRLTDSLVTSLLFEQNGPSTAKEPVLTFVDPVSKAMLDVKSIDSFGDELEIRSSLLEAYPQVLLMQHLHHAYVYVLSQRALSILAALPDSSVRSFQDDLLPVLCKSQWQPGLLDKLCSGMLAS